VAVAEHRRFACGVEPIAVDERMAVGMVRAGGIDETDVLHADAAKFGGDELGGVANVGGVLGEGGDGWNTQQSL